MDTDRTTNDADHAGGEDRAAAAAAAARRSQANAKRAATRHAQKMRIRDENFRKVVSEARAGGSYQMSNVKWFLDRYPDLWDRIDDASRQVRAAWVGALTGGDHVRILAVSRELDTFAAAPVSSRSPVETVTTAGTVKLRADQLVTPEPTVTGPVSPVLSGTPARS